MYAAPVHSVDPSRQRLEDHPMSLPTFVTHYMVRRPKSAGRTQSNPSDAQNDFARRLDRKARGGDTRQNSFDFGQSGHLRRAG